MQGVSLVHDVLDAQLVDMGQEKMGRVDGLTLELRDGEPPRVGELLVGGTVIAERTGRWMVALTRAFARLTGIQPLVTRFSFDDVRVIGDTLELDVDACTTSALRSERYIDDRLISRIPGSRGDKPGGRDA